MKRSLAVGIVLALAVSSFAPAKAQERKTNDGMKATGATSMKALTIQGTVKSIQADGIVVKGKDQAKVGQESGKEREWVFATNEKTSIKRGQTAGMVADLKPGDEVTVSYTEDGGKVIAQSVTVRDGGAGTTPATTRDVPAGKK